MKATISCVGKREYADFVTAREMARRTNNDRDGARVMPYRCKLCTRWHLGTHDKPVKRRQREERDS